jgi:hypothetical protein
MNQTLFYIINTILVFACIMPLFAIIELITLIVVKQKTYVDNKIGRIVDFHWEHVRIRNPNGRSHFS